MNLHQRWVGLDITKALCVFFMVFIHSSFWLITNQDEVMSTESFMYPIITKTTFFGLFPLSLPATAGCGLRMYMERTKAQGKEMDLWQLSKISIAIMLLGYAMTILAWGFSHRFEWDVLHFVGLSYLIVALLLKVTTVPLLLTFGAFTLLATNPMRDVLGDSSGFLKGILISDNTGFFFWPIFPWFATLVFGFGVAHFYLATRDSKTFRSWLFAIAVLCIGFAISGNEFLLKLDPEDVWGANVFQPAVGFIFGIIGFFSALILIGSLIGDRIQLKNMGFIHSFSQGILWIYLLHIIVGVRISGIYKQIVPINAFTALLFSFALLAFCWAVGKASILLSEKKLRVTFVKTN